MSIKSISAAALALCMSIICVTSPIVSAMVYKHQPHKGIVIRNDLQHYFTDAGTTGTMFTYDTATNKETVVNSSRVSTGYLPGSTFKVLNSLILLQKGVIAGPDAIIPGPRPPIIVNGKSFLPDVCQQSITLVDAFRNSCANAYQQLTRKLDIKTYKHYIQQIGYGNRDITSVPLDEFWLEGDLKITPQQQVLFLKRLHDNKLPFSNKTMQTVKTMMLSEQTGTYTIRAKTGWVYSLQPNVGWWVGWVERGNDTTYFALNVDISNDSQAALRKSVAKDILGNLGYL